MTGKEVNAMTIKTKIETELKRLSEEKAEILSVAEELN